MTTTLSRQPTGQSSISMTVAGQLNTAGGQTRDDQALYFTLGSQGNHPVDPWRVVDFKENSFRGPRNPQMVYGISMAKGEQEPLFTRLSVDEPEHSWFRASLEDVQAEGFEGNPWVVGENFGRPHTDRISWLAAHSFDGRVYQRRPRLLGALIPFEDSRRAFIEANRHLVSQRRQERARMFDPETTRDMWVAPVGFFVAFQAKSGVYDKRIETLRRLAADEEIKVNEASVEDFRYFVGFVVPTQNAQLIVMDNGNLRAVWKNDEGSHLGLQFLGGRRVQFVVFRRGGPERKVDRLAGESSFDEMRKSIGDWGLSPLVSA